MAGIGANGKVKFSECDNIDGQTTLIKLHGPYHFLCWMDIRSYIVIT